MLRRRFWLLAVLFVIPAFAAAQAPKPLPPAEAKAAFLKLLDRPKVPLDAKYDPSAGSGDLVRERISIASEERKWASPRTRVTTPPRSFGVRR